VIESDRYFGIIVHDAGGMIRYVNQAFSKSLGYSDTEIAEGAVNWKSLTPTKFCELDVKMPSSVEN